VTFDRADTGGPESVPIAGPDRESAPEPFPTGRRRRSRRRIVELLVVVLVAVVVVAVVRTCVFQTFAIPSGSMEPTLLIGDRIVVDKLSFDLHPVDRGDVVVFRRPAADHCPGSHVRYLVKRVVGLPTETVSARHGVVYIDGRRLAEPWLPKASTSYTAISRPVHVPRGEYFMMGDDRVDSCDSRSWGPIPRSLMVGEVVFRIWPLSRIHFF
jgi:signal peptidase I